MALERLLIALERQRPMDQSAEFLTVVFDRVRDRLTERKDSLCLFVQHWHGRNGGIEGWLKVEFVAAVSADVCVVRTGSATTPKTRGKDFPDLRLESEGYAPVDIELKAATNWSPTYGKPLSQYDGRALFFLCGAPAESLEKKRKWLAETACPGQLVRICRGIQCTDNQQVDFLFGFVDLRYRGSNAA